MEECHPLNPMEETTINSRECPQLLHLPCNPAVNTCGHVAHPTPIPMDIAHSMRCTNALTGGVDELGKLGLHQSKDETHYWSWTRNSRAHQPARKSRGRHLTCALPLTRVTLGVSNNCWQHSFCCHHVGLPGPHFLCRSQALIYLLSKTIQPKRPSRI